jgi:pimeloyl-ACP methyl ester carboxylesterase
VAAVDDDVRYAGYEQHVTADGTRLAYRVQGDGEAFVVVSSTLESSTAWRAFSRRAARRRRVVIYDPRGVGRSSGGPVDHEHHLRDLRSLLAALSIDRAVLMGHSIATQLCVRLANERPELVGGLVLLGPMINPGGCERRRRMFAGWAQALALGGTPAMFDVFWPQILCDATFERGGAGAFEAYRELWIADSDRDAIAAQLAAAIAADGAPLELGAVSCPALLLAGEDDFLATTSALRESAAALPDARVSVLAGVGHVPHLEAPLALHQAIDRFVADALPAPAPAG